MMSLFDKGFSKREILQRVGNIKQFAGAEDFLYSTGKARGVRGIRVRNGRGLDFVILPDKGMDILDLYYKGIQLSWLSPNGVVNNAFFNSEGTGWLESFAGGALVTCGLRNVGPPCEEDGTKYGLHGTYTSLPAEYLKINEYWEEDHYHIEISGKITDPIVFGNTLSNIRTIHVSSRENSITIRDRISNEGSSAEPLMLLYHFNWGSPLFSERARLRIHPAHTTVRGGTAEPGSWADFEKPQPLYEEVVYFHILQAEKDKMAGYELSDPDLGFDLSVKWDHQYLPCFTQWKMCGEGTYVLGLEPGNCFPENRVSARRNDRLEILPPKGVKETRIIVRIRDDDS